MYKKEVAEIKKQYTKDRCPATRICGCFVDGEKNKKAVFEESLLSMPEEDLFKYMDILKKIMSGNIGKALHNLDFPIKEESAGGKQHQLMELKKSNLLDKGALNIFYDDVIQSLDYVGNYLILLAYGVYDIPQKGTDNKAMDDSDEVYEHIICCICPVNLSKPGLSYQGDTKCFASRVLDWLAEPPILGFLFPAFNERSADIHSMLYFTKKMDDTAKSFVNGVLGSYTPMPAQEQKDCFASIVSSVMGTECTYENARDVHEEIAQMIEDQNEQETPCVLSKEDVRRMLEACGASNEQMADFDQSYDAIAGEDTVFQADNITDTKKMEIQTDDVLVHVNPVRADLVKTAVIDGQNCLVIKIEHGMTVNGVLVGPGGFR